MNTQLDAKPRLKITIFIHGTILPLLTPAIIKQTVKNYWETQSGIFHHYHHALRSKSMYRNQLIAQPGLHEITFLKGENHCINWTLCSAYQHMHKTYFPDDKQRLKFYTYGWDGLFSYQARYNAAKELYDGLIQLQKDHSTYDLTFSIVAHSHGVNIALFLAKIALEKETKLIIHELISFGAPVQQETEAAIEQEMFKSVYHFYSRGDWIQLLDVFTTAGRRSHRTFSTHNPKVKQVSLDVNNVKPGHASLCFFGQRPHEYKLATNPLPPLVFAPWMIAWLNTQEGSRHHLSIRKDDNVVWLVANNADACHDIVDWQALVNRLSVDYAG